MEFDFTKEPGRELLDRGLVTDGEPLVSIITPYYNAVEYFEQTFNSVMNQTFPWFEWIIVDDGSTDISAAYELKKYASCDRRIILLRQENSGQSLARNIAAKHSRTDILVPLDADDLIAPVFLEEIYWALYCNPKAAWAYSDSLGFQENEYVWKQPFSSDRMKTENILVCTAGIRKNAFIQAGGYDASEKHYDEDWCLWLRLLALGLYPVHINNCLFWYRRRSNGMQKEVQGSRTLQELSQKKVKAAAKEIKTCITAKEYPCRTKMREYDLIHASTWGKKIFAEHKKIRVMLLLPWMEMGGADLFNLDICRNIDKNRFEVSILTTVQSQNSWRQRFEDYVTDIFTLSDFLDEGNFPEFISYFIRSREVDVLFLSNSYYGYYLVPWIRREFPALAIIDYVHMEEWYWRNGGYARTSGVMGDVLEKTFVCNERTRQVLIHDFGREPESVETLYIGVDQDTYDARKVVTGQVRQELGIAEGRPIVLFPCRIHPQKRPFMMIEIAKCIKKQFPKIAFVVVGDGPQMDELAASIKQNELADTVYLVGRKSDMRPYYKDSALTLICSIKEGLALTAYESLSMGKPVITSDVGGQAELIDSSVGCVLPLMQSEENDLNNRDFSDKEIIQYVTAIKTILSDQKAYDVMCLNCRAKIENSFSSQIMIRKLEQIFEEIVFSDKMKTDRRQTSEHLKTFHHIVDDYVMVFQMFEASQSECDEVWRSREWFRQLYENMINEGRCELTNLPQNEGDAQRQLEEIYQMRTWKLLQKYRHFMDCTWIGKFFSKLRDIFRR